MYLYHSIILSGYVLSTYLHINIANYFVGASADDEGDYVYQNYSFVLNSTDDEYPVILRPVDDNIVEPDEYYTLVMSLVPIPSHFMIVNDIVTVTIYNDDGK